jgi:hypothetical protein
MKTVLTKEQIEHLFVFCRKHYVRYYDVQLELVDHLANAIEDKMNADKNLSFEKALHEVYKGFGVMGFSKVLASKEKEAGKKCRKIRRKIYWSYFTPPKLAMTVCVFIGLFILKNIFPEDNLMYVLGALLFLLVTFEFIIIFKIARLFKKAKKSLLIFKNNYPGTFSLFLFQVFAQSKFYNLNLGSNFYYAIFSLLFTSFFVGALSYKNYCIKLFDLAKMQYPQAFAETI